MVGVDTARLVRHFLDLVCIDSPSMEEAAVANRLERDLADLGLEVRNDLSHPIVGGNLIGVMRGNASGTPILLSAHMDVVEPGRGVKPVIDGEFIRSDGTTVLGADDKAAISAILEALRVVRESRVPHGDIEVVLTYAEEGSLLGANRLDPSLLNAEIGFVADDTAPPGTVVVAAPGQNRIRATFIGRAAHAGLNPELGVNALLAASRAICDMRLGRIDEETTANIGVIKGGTAMNIVPDRVEVEGEARSRRTEGLRAQTQSMAEAMESAARSLGVRLDLKIEQGYRAFRLDDSSRVVQFAWLAAEDAGLRPALRASGGGSDANVFNARGLPTVVLGTGMCQPHSLDEHIRVSDLNALARHLVAIIRRATRI